jgi:hypothetical protein
LTGFGFAVLAALLFLLFVDPPRAIQLVIIISTALSLVTLPGLWRAIASALMLRLGLGSLVGLPLGLIAFRYADPVQVRALVGATILGFAVPLGSRQRRGAGEPRGLFSLRPGRDLATGAVSGIATALVGMAGPPDSTPSPPRPWSLSVNDYIAAGRDITTRNSDGLDGTVYFLKRRFALQHSFADLEGSCGRLSRILTATL